MGFHIPSRPERVEAYGSAGLWSGDTLHGLLAQNAKHFPDREAVVDQPNKHELTGAAPVRLTFLQLERASSACARDLAARGVNAGDRVVLQLPNTAELIVLYYALSKLGAIISPVAVQYGRHEIAHFTGELEPAAFITVKNLRGADLAAQARSAAGAIPVWTVDEDLHVLAGAENPAGAGKPADDAEADGDDWAADADAVLTIAWTSGTTGTPKGVPRTHHMWMAQGRLTSLAARFNESERLLSPFPMINMAALGGFLLPSALHGCTLVLHHPLEVPVYLTQLQDEAINFTLAPPPLLNRLAQQPELWEQFNFSSLRAIGSGSVPLSPAMIEVFEERFRTPIINFYGSNEGIGLISTPENSPSAQHRASLFPRCDDVPRRAASDASGMIVTRIIDPDSGAVIDDAGCPGELCVDGPGVFDGYLNHDGQGVFTADGFFRSGDLVEIAPEQPTHYRIVGRCKDIINRGGTKLSPAEIDSQLEGMSGLAEAAVCAYADEDLGERVCACVVPLEGTEAPTLEAVRAYLSDRGLARFKLPERLEGFERLPRNPLGKVLRDDLRDAVESRSSADG